MKRSFVLVVTLLSAYAQVASANGIRQGAPIAASIDQALNGRVLNCVNGSDRIELNNSQGHLRMVATMAGGISHILNSDSDNHGGGECGGLSVFSNAQFGDLVLDDEYNDCERGDWGYRIMISKNTMAGVAHGSVRSFSAGAYTIIQGKKNGSLTTLECTLQ